METRKYQMEFGGKPLSVEIGKLAGQANGACYVQYGNTAILVTATMSPHARLGINYFPLSVDYEEKYYAAGKMKGSKWIKRETRPSDEAILSGRLIDRSLRPRFNQKTRNEVQVVAMVLAFDGINDPDMPSLFGASLALMISDIPFNGPVASARIGRVAGKLVFNPTYEERKSPDFDIVVAGTADRINMIEAGANIVPEQEMSEAIIAGFKEYKKLIDFQNKIAKEIGKKKTELEFAQRDPDFEKMVRDFVGPKLEKVIYIKDKLEFVSGHHKTGDELQEYVKDKLGADTPGLENKIDEAKIILEEEMDRIVHKNIIESEKRPDGRKIDQVREIWSEVGVLPNSHGVGLFNRGTTQALTSLTLAAPGMEQWVETMEIELTKKRFMHHYVFPPFSVGETGRMGSGGRREIGHGALAERALVPLIPPKDEFPYTIRLVSEILSSNGSSSMASVCGSILALMDGGVPIKAAAAGIAMGLMTDEKSGKYKVLTDIQGPEDHHGDMDLKVAGTKDGITAMQMDVKIEGINEEMLKKALEQAKKARLEILDSMLKTIAEPRKELSPFAPRVQTMNIDPSKIGAVIGKGGETINKIIEETGAEIDIEDDGSIFITCVSAEGMARAMEIIKELTYEPKPGDEFDGKVVKIMDFGAFVEIMPGKDGLVHVSEISKEHVRRPADVLRIGQTVHIKVKNIDEYGRINLTMK